MIGADGTYSSVRAVIHRPAPQPIYTGHMSFRWLLRGGPPARPGRYVRSDNQRLIIGRLPDDRTYVATGLEMEQRPVDRAEARALLDESGVKLLELHRANADSAGSEEVRARATVVLNEPY